MLLLYNFCRAFATPLYDKIRREADFVI